MPDLNYHHLRYFRAVAHDGNLTRAAARMNLSQSALSAQIRTLEDRLGQKLFDRQGRALVLTEAGRIALEHADAIFATGDELLATLAERRSADPVTVRVGAIATLSRNFQVGFLQPLLGRPGVRILVRSGRMSDLLQSLETHSLDVVLANERPPRDEASRLIVHRIAEQTISLVARPERVGEGDTAETLLAREPVLVPTVETALRAEFDAFCASCGLTPRIVAEIDDMAMIRALTREDIGVAVVPPIVVKDELRSGELVEGARLPRLSETFFAITLDRRFPNPLLVDLLEGASGGP